MTPVPLIYSLRNLWQRRMTTLLTIVGIGLAVFVLAALLMAANGLNHALVDSGSNDNAIFVRQPATSESRSVILRHDAATVEALPGIGRGVSGEKLVARELALPVDILSATGKRGMPVMFRGTSLHGLELRSHARIAEGRFFRPMTDEVVLGAKLIETHHFQPGGVVEIGHRRWRIAGVFEISNTALDNEIWGDVDQVMQSFRRGQYSSLLVRLDGAGGFAVLSKAVANDLRSELSVWIERDFYGQQADSLSRFLRTFALFMGGIFSVGAAAGATITMYASVAHRTREIGTLRALGFEPGSILLSILTEAGLIGLLGGGVGVSAAAGLGGFSLTTLNVQTYSGITFQLLLTPEIGIEAILFALTLGIAGGLLPAWRATKISIHDALREIG